MEYIKDIGMKSYGNQGRQTMLGLYRCDCGTEYEAMKSHVKSGTRLHCKECARMNRINSLPIKHGQASTKLYKAYTGMKQRCYNPNNKAYKNYGSRGITICDEWRNNPQSFFTWAKAHGYKEGLTIERRDNNGNYEPTNCYYTTRVKNLNNRRNSLDTRFTKEQQESIAMEYTTTTISNKEIRRKYNISGTSLRKILNGKIKSISLRIQPKRKVV